MERLHFHPLSPYSRKAYVAGLLRGEAFEPVVLQLGAGALRRPEFLALSPFGKMPVLETEEGPLFESTSIIERWEERGPALLLPPESARVARHFDRLGDLYLIASVATLWWEPESDEARNAPATVALAWRLFAEQLARGGPFVAGERFTLGDLGAAIATDFLQRLDVQPPAPIADWCSRCFELPAMHNALAEAMPFVERLHPKARAAARG